eukprot:3459112-Pyramimonas_sp.AAC.1
MGRRRTIVRRQRSKKRWQRELRLMCIGGMWTSRGVGRYAACPQRRGRAASHTTMPRHLQGSYTSALNNGGSISLFLGSPLGSSSSPAL